MAFQMNYVKNIVDNSIILINELDTLETLQIRHKFCGRLIGSICWILTEWFSIRDGMRRY